MKTKLFALTSAASLALAGALLVTPASAQYDNGRYYPRESTPEEMRRTDMLNSQAAQQAQTVTRSNDEALSEYSRSQEEYQQRLQQHSSELQRHQDAQRQYDERFRAYQDRNETYASERDRYEVNQRIYQDILANLDDRRFALITYPGQRWMMIPGVSEAALEGSLVRDRFGRVVGTIEDVDLPRVTVRLNSGRVVWVRYPRLRYDVDRNVVLTDLSYADLQSMPRAIF